MSPQIKDNPGAAPQATVDIQSVLRDLTKKSRSPVQLYRSSFRALARHFSSVCGCIKTSLPSGSVDDSYRPEGSDTSRWDKTLHAVVLKVQGTHEPLFHVVKVSEEEQYLILAVPLKGGVDSATGALVLVAQVPDMDQAKAYLFELKALSDGVENRALEMEREIKSRVRGEDVDRAVARAASYGTIEELAFAITNNLRAKTGSDQVAFGLRRGETVRIVSISGIDDPNLRSSGTTLIEQAMDECLDRKQAIVVQSDDLWAEGALSTGHKLHARWRDAIGGATVASLPLLDGEECVAVVSLRRPVSEAFTADELTKIERLVAPLGTGLRLLRQANQSLPSHLGRSLARGTRWLGSPRAIGRKIVLLGLIAGLLWFSFGTSAYEIPAPGTLTASTRRFHTAPFDGRLASVRVRTGDSVAEGDLLIRMDTRDLDLQRDELRASLAGLNIQLKVAVGAGDQAEAQLLRARLQASRIKLKSLDRRIGLAEVRATCSGKVMDGEIQLKIGQVVGRGDTLCIVASEKDIILEISIAEDSAADIEPGLKVHFASHARPESPLLYRIQRVRPFAEQREQSNVFVAEAVLDMESLPDYVRIGMDGSALVIAGRRRVWWLAFHRLIERFQLKFWL